jgi:hypothetical protein
MGDLERLKKELEKTKREISNAKMNNDYHTRKMRQALEENKPTEYEVHSLKAKFSTDKIPILMEKEFQVGKSINDLEELVVKGVEKARVKSFDLAMYGDLEGIRDSLKFLIEKGRLPPEDLQQQILHLIEFYNGQNKYGANDVHWGQVILPYETLNLFSVKIRIQHVIEEYSFACRLESPLNAQKVANYTLWSQHIIGQINDCLGVIVERSGLDPSFFKKVKV